MSTPVITTGLEPVRIDVTSAIDAIAAPWCGAIVTFEGRVRNHHNNRSVTALFYEAYEERAESQLRTLAETCIQRHELGGVVAIHRTGDVKLGDIAVLVAAASAHRDVAFEATRWLIDEIKASVAIWKKEIFSDGEAWVGLNL